MSEQLAEVGGLRICYEVIGAPGDPPIVLVGGLNSQLIRWPDSFCAELVARGYRVVRFDNRDSGRSSLLTAKPRVLRALLGRGEPAYTIDDLAGDTVGLLDAIGIDRAHLVGMSMGGMIAQTVAIRYPHRVLSLTSMMSTSGAHGVGKAQVWPALRFVLRRLPDNPDKRAQRLTAMAWAISSPGFPRDLLEMRTRAQRYVERGMSPEGSHRQLIAVLTATDRTEGLRKLAMPTLVVHGDRDPLVHVSGGRSVAESVPHAELMEISGMAHDLPTAVHVAVVDAFCRTAERLPG